MKTKQLRLIWTMVLSVVLEGVMAQGVPITLNQGWNWISYPYTQPMSIEEAMGSFTPAEGDQLKSQQGSIGNGGNLPNQWRTLTLEEWAYVFNTRSTSTGIRYAKATVNNVNGVVLLPDNWKSSYYSLNSTNTSDAAFTTNVISASDWVTLESQGAVFLPAAGRRNGTSVSDVGSNGYYCSSSYCDSNSAYNMHFGDGYLYAGNGWGYRYRGFSVRLVRSAR